MNDRYGIPGMPMWLWPKIQARWARCLEPFQQTNEAVLSVRELMSCKTSSVKCTAFEYKLGARDDTICLGVRDKSTMVRTSDVQTLGFMCSRKDLLTCVQGGLCSS